MHAVPGGPWDREKALAPAVVENLNRRYGVDLPIWMQYLRFISNALRGDLGVSSFGYQDRGITEILLQGLPVTAMLGGLALAFALVVGIPLGIAAALRQNTWVDYLCVFFATLGASAPSFVMGIILVYVLAVVLHLLPTRGWGPWEQALMPSIALGALPASHFARITRASMLEVMRQDFVRTAYAKGLSSFGVITGHIVKNMLIPVVTVIGLLAAALVTGSFIIESLFSIPGIGRLYVQGVFQRHYALIIAITAITMMAFTFLGDGRRDALDPRMKQYLSR